MDSCFNVIQKLGSGNFGKVFLITRNKLIHTEAYKKIPDQVSIKIEKYS